MYKDVTINNIINNNDIVTINKWFKTRTDKLVISGDIGTGKSSLIQLIKKKFNLKVHSFYLEELCNEVKNEIEQIITHQDILNLLQNNISYNCIVFDNLQKNNKYIEYLIDKYPNSLIIITSTKKYISEYTINIQKKTKNYLLTYFKNRIKCNTLTSIINNSNGDINYIKKTIDYIKINDNKINIKKLTKDIDYDNYSLLLKFLNKSKIKEYFNDINFVYFLYTNIFEILKKFNINDKKIINDIYCYLSQTINFSPDFNYIFLLGLKNILKSNKQKIKSVNVKNSLLINNIYVRGTYIKYINKNCKELNINNEYFYEYILWLKKEKKIIKSNKNYLKYLLI